MVGQEVVRGSDEGCGMSNQLTLFVGQDNDRPGMITHMLLLVASLFEPNLCLPYLNTGYA